jgi:hypothetical protein
MSMCDKPAPEWLKTLNTGSTVCVPLRHNKWSPTEYVPGKVARLAPTQLVVEYRIAGVAKPREIRARRDDGGVVGDAWSHIGPWTEERDTAYRDRRDREHLRARLYSFKYSAEPIELIRRLLAALDALPTEKDTK